MTHTRATAGEYILKVTKRDGRLESSNINKIKKCIEWAATGTNVNPIELESKIDAVMYDGIKTEDIHNNLIYHANTLASYDRPDWALVAGRLYTMQRWSETKAYDQPFVEFVMDMVNKGSYDERFVNAYTTDNINALGDKINQELDLDHTYTSVVNAGHKYLVDGECIQQMHMLNAMTIMMNESGDRIQKVVDAYDRLSKRTSSLATPWLGNLRIGGNISSCFIYEFDDNRQSIADNFSRIIHTSAEGGGMGISLARIRAEGSEVAGRKGASKGVTYCIKVINDLAAYFDQGGRRAGAITVALPVWHRDIETFLEIQDENKDPRRQSFDVFMQVGAFDPFMDALENKTPWYTFCPHEVESKVGICLTECFGDKFRDAYDRCVEAYESGILCNVQVHSNPRDLAKMFIRKWLERGTPYIAFMDEINRHNPNKHDGYIPCVNLCVESYSNVQADKYGHTCNLASIVAGRMNSFEDFRRESSFLTRVLSNGLDLTSNPDVISKNHNDRYRTIGVGVMSKHDWLVKNNKNYSDLDFITKTFEYVMYGCIEESIDLAKERGAYPAFDGSDWQNGTMIDKFKKESVSPELDWSYLQDQIDIHGIFNSQLTSPAPNTSTSLFMDSSAGVMPVYSAFYYDDNAVGATPVPAMYLNEKPLAYGKSQVKHDQKELTKAVAAMQKFVDTGISSEYIFDRNDPSLNAKTLYDLLIESWRNKTKAMYYVRTNKKEIACESCAG